MPDLSVNPTDFMQQLLKGYQKTAGGLYNLNAAYLPLYTNLNLQGQQQGQFGTIDPTTGQLIQPGTLQMGRAGNTYTRTGDVSDVQTLGRSGYDALLQSNPGLASALRYANASGAASSAPNSLLSILSAHALDDSASPLLKSLQSDAQRTLAAGGKLTPEQERDISEQTGSLFSQRGMPLGNAAIGAELLNRDKYSQERLAAARQYASGVEGLGQQQVQGARGFALGVQGANSQNQTLLNQLTSLNQNVYDPFQTITGRGSSAIAGIGGGGGNPSAAGGGFNVPTIFNPNFNDAFSTAANANFSQDIADQNRTNALIGAGGNLLGAALQGYLSGGFSDERLKKKIKTVAKKPIAGGSGKPVRVIEWEYKTDPAGRRYRGRSAQDVERERPDAVVTEPLSGLKAINYRRLGETMTLASAIGLEEREAKAA